MEVLEEVACEERVQHDVLGCPDCYEDPHNGHMTYCLLSVYNSFHPSHMCLAGAPCSCNRYLADLELYLYISWILCHRSLCKLA